MNHAIILAAGQGQRMKNRKDKLLLPIDGRPLIYYSIMALHDHSDIDSIIIVANKLNKKDITQIIKTYNFYKIKKIIIGGLRRQDSLESGLKVLEKSAKKDDIILVHNAANPFPGHDEITELIEITEAQGACIVGHFIPSTVKEINGQHVIKTHDRDKLFAAETPQAMQYPLLRKALKHVQKKGIDVTDEAMMLEEIEHKVPYIESSEDNFKVTTQADYQRARTIMGELPEDFRIGIGQDSHMFDEGKKGLTLGGVFFKDEVKLKANSDGDVILHAIFNALSQAIGDRSLGFYADEKCEKGVTDSTKYLDIVLKNAKKQKLEINSLGLMIECKTPKMDPIVPKLKKSLSKILGLHSRRIGITATTGEELTSFGQGLGIQCFAIASLVKK